MISRPLSRGALAAIRTSLTTIAVASASLIGVTPSVAQTTIAVPANRGDQMIYFFDARTGRTPFLTVANPSAESVVVEVAFYPASLTPRLGQEVRTLAGGANLVIDPTEAAGGVANGNAGLVVLTPIAGADNPTPIVPPQPLVGGFTLANTALQSAFGENAFGRLAVNGSGARAAAGTPVDGSSVRYQRFVPGTLMVPAYFNPQSLGPVEQDGNRVVLVSFSDQYGTRFDPVGRAATAQAAFFAGSGAPIGGNQGVDVNGVLLSNLQAIAGEGALTSSGKVFFALDAGSNGSAFGIFSQSLGTFASGQRMPAVARIPTSGPTPTAGTPTPGATPTPTSGGSTPTPGGGGQCVQGSKVKVTVAINWDTQTPPGQALASAVAIRLDYPEAALEIPGTGQDPSVQQAVEYVTSANLSSGVFSAVDDGDSVLAIGGAVIPEAIPTGNFARITFDCKAGAAVPSAGSFACTTPGDGIGDQNGQIYPNGSCSIAQVAKQ